MFSGSLVAIVTPMHPDGGIDWQAWERLLALHLEAGTTGVVVGGTTGESPTLSDEELSGLLERARARLRGRALLLAGAGTNNTAATVERARRLSAAGVDGLLVVTPAYNRPTQEGLFRNFEAVAAASSVPVMLYNVPSRTAVDLLPATVARLAKLPRIVAVKEALAQIPRVLELRALLPAGFGVLSGDDVTAAEALANGAQGVVSVTANVVPGLMVQLVASALRGDRAGASRTDGILRPLHQALFVEANPIPVKWAMAQLGIIEGGIRLPLTPLSEHFRPQVRAALEAVMRATQAPRAQSA
jgi:4-hydroxy-tetrahydrodipicolinate synthase